MSVMRHPRRAALVGILFGVIGRVYWGVQAVAGWGVGYAGVTMLLLLGVAMAIMAYVLVAGSTSD